MRNFFILLFFSLISTNTAFGQLPVNKNGRFLEINKAQIYFEEYGEGEPLFLLHGFLNTADNWSNFIEEYSKNYRVIIWDMRGHGRSTNPDDQKDFKHQQAAMDLLELMDKLTIDKTKAIGHSSGAITILYAASIAPEKFEAIIPIAGQHHYSEPVRDWIKSKIWEDFFDQEELDSLHGRKKSELLKRQFYNFWKLNGDPSLSNEQLQRITARTLVVHGDNDFIPVTQAWEIYNNIPNARIWISPNTGHMPQYGPGNDTDFIRRSLDFLKGEGW
ncbi:alpha/beta hydrolase [Algoriphagus aquimarinus]|uniref:alpha/beta fold hydrolase n=1 Tax=Algoriphagus aquimarinus TaxID=237018 RepID=UPI0030DAAC91|tara:strand:- start:95540 stop:96361 length:822 start_codon:yes stop_codon:yes gene_type:complete